MGIADARGFKKRLIMLSYQDAYKIADSVHKGQQDKAGGPYIDFLQNVADYLKNKGEPEDVQVLAILQDSITSGTKKTPDDMIKMGVPADMVELIQKMTYHKNQAWIDEYSCHLMEKGVPAEDATYDAREKDFVRFVETLKDNPTAAKAKSAILNVLLEDKYIHRQERRELKTKFRLKKYKAAIQALGV
jgi:(p)ppGpp synthase/HD superfamily hydrolase